MSHLTIADFTCSNKWELDSSDPNYIVDQMTGQRYRNRPDGDIRLEACCNASLYCVSNSILSICFVCYRTLKIITFYHFWPRAYPVPAEPETNRIVVLAKDPKSKSKLEVIPEGIESEAIENKPQYIYLSCKERTQNGCVECLKLLAIPINSIALECLACANLIYPSNNGRKLYHSFEYLQFDSMFTSSIFRVIPEMDAPILEEMK